MGNDFPVSKQITPKPIHRPAPARTTRPGAGNVSFNNLLQQTIADQPLKFSAHTQKRMTANRVNLSTDQIRELEQAVKKAEQKGGKESLILINDLAFVVSINNRTVITAIDQKRMQDNVFTNIDSAVISGKN